jgi:glutathione S-transferase
MMDWPLKLRMTLSLYGGARSRASMPRWYLEEKAIPYEWHQLAMEDGEHRRPPFTAINPFGKVPALVDDSLEGPDGEPLRLFESGAILLHLAERYGREFDGDPDGAIARRSLTVQWLLFANATLSMALFLPAIREKEFPRLMEVLDPLLEGGRSLLAGPRGDPGWGAADCAVQAHLAYLPIFAPQVDLSPYPNVRATIESVQQQPSYLRGMGKQ